MEFTTRPCLNSGFCCTKAPCAYGEKTSDTNYCCKYLLQPNEIGQKLCGRYQWIIDNVPPEIWRDFTPAFGGGCCMPIGNEARNKIKETLDALGLEEHTKPFKQNFDV
jgi:hypothetical protein